MFFEGPSGAAENIVPRFRARMPHFALTFLVNMANLLVARSGGRHVPPHQKVRTALLSPDRRKPLARRPAPADRPGHPRPPRPTPNQRPDRRPTHLRGTLRPENPAAQRASPGASARD